MKSPDFIEGAVIALIISIGGSMLYGFSAAEIPVDSALRLVIALSGFVYIAYLFKKSPRRSGRISAVSVWMLATLLLWFLEPSLLLYLILHMVMIWLFRSLCYHSSLLTSLADLGLSGLALVAGLWAASVAGSLFLSIWAFFLVQALFTHIPFRLPRREKHPTTNDATENDAFEYARKGAETALQDLLRH